MSSYAQRIVELAHRVTGIDQRLVSIAEERGSHAVEAAQGGKTALQRIASLDAELDQLTKSKATLTDAASQLDAQMRAEELEALMQSRAEREQKAREIGSAVVAVQSEIDHAMVQLREMFERRETLLNQLHRAGGIDSRATFRLASKENANAAAYHAQLNRFLDLSHIGPQQQRPLSDSDRVIPH
jgi:hypothetical protein